MQRFRFRLARAERLRLAERRQARAALAIALGEERAAEQGCEQATDDLRSARERMLSDGELLDAASLRERADTVAGLTSRSVRAAAALEAATAALAIAEREHEERARDHRALERLHERRRRAWTDSADRQEQGFLDEISLKRSSSRSEEVP